MVVVAFAFCIELEDIRHRAVFFGPLFPRLLGHEAERRIGLGIEVDQQHAKAVIASEVSGEVHGDGRLADAAFHIHE